MVKEELTLEIPRPHYLQNVKVSENGESLGAKVIFPLSDETVADRKDHVGAGHLMFAIEHAGHLMMAQKGEAIGKKLGHPLVSELEMRFLGITPPDEPVDLKMEALELQVKERLISAKMHAEFNLHGQLLVWAQFKVTVLRQQA